MRRHDGRSAVDDVSFRRRRVPSRGGGGCLLRDDTLRVIRLRREPYQPDRQVAVPVRLGSGVISAQERDQQPVAPSSRIRTSAL